MKGNSTYKVTNGKLIRIELQAEQNKITSIKVSGDFFMHPEQAIQVLEKQLHNSELDEAKLQEKISSIVEENSVQLFGFKPEDLAKAIMMAVKK